MIVLSRRRLLQHLTLTVPTVASCSLISSAALAVGEKAKENRVLASTKALWPKLKTYGDVLKALLDSAKNGRLLIVDVAWDGCSGCTNSDLAKAMIDLKKKYDLDINVKLGAIAWRNYRDLSVRVNQSFKLISALTLAKKQKFGGGRPVENYSTNPPNWRRHFPQIFFLDGNGIDASSVQKLIDFDMQGRLFFPQTSMEHSGELQLDDDEVRQALDSGFGKGAVLLQMLNEHLFAVPNDDFQSVPFVATEKCVYSQYKKQLKYPRVCFRYERSH